GWFVVDNLPVTLIDKIVELSSTSSGGGIPRLALVVGPTADQAAVIAEIHRLRAGGQRVRVLFLDASTGELVKRYGSTRRKHPLDDGAGITMAIERERALLEPVKAEADMVLDTTALTVH
ncbi:MAG TPA: RNase adapter RapZ, partial [Ilumatobacteraceae bacterium]|nr:RNase adapter RapZ [Ilumatobacteraceae bacterium]